MTPKVQQALLGVVFTLLLIGTSCYIHSVTVALCATFLAIHTVVLIGSDPDRAAKLRLIKDVESLRYEIDNLKIPPHSLSVIKEILTRLGS